MPAAPLKPPAAPAPPPTAAPSAYKHRRTPQPQQSADAARSSKRIRILDHDLRYKLQALFGMSDFKPGQEEVIMALLGGRSAAACQYLAENGFTNLTNMTEGFEGRVDEAGHRNSFEGWRARNLPWFQS